MCKIYNASDDTIAIKRQKVYENHGFTVTALISVEFICINETVSQYSIKPHSSNVKYNYKAIVFITPYGASKILNAKFSLM